MQMTKDKLLAKYALGLASAAVFATGVSQAQPAPSATPERESDEEVIVLSPFEVSAAEERGYAAATTLAGNRLNTDLRDVGSAIQVVTSQFLADTGAVNNETLLQYTTSTEVGNVFGNFAGLGDGARLDERTRFTNPNQNTRVRGLTNADNTRDYFLSDIPWDGYNIDRVDLSRGPNSILFGQGSPAGIINAGVKMASFRNANTVEVRVDNHGSVRGTLDVNRVLLKDELAIRIMALADNQKFQQRPAFQDDHRIAGALRYEPGFLKRGSARTIFKVNGEAGKVRSNRPRTLPPLDFITPWFWTGSAQGRYVSNGSDINGNPVQTGDARVYENLNKLVINPHMAQNDNFYAPEFAHGLTRPSINGGPYGGRFNPYFNPWIGNFGNAIGGPTGYFDTLGSSTPSRYMLQEIRGNWGINSSGNPDNGVGGFQFNRLVSLNSYGTYAQRAGLPFAEFGVYKDNSITDPTIFDFYNNLLDGPNKKEWQDFNVINLSLSQTFLDDKIGFDLTYNREEYKNGQISFMSGGQQGIYIDINTTDTDGTNLGKARTPGGPVIPFEDGTPNQNLGRAFVGDNGAGGNSSYRSDRNSKRATGFVTHDFDEEGSGNFLTNFLGRHTLTALWGRDEQKTDNRSWARYAVLDPQWRAFINNTAVWTEGQNFLPSAVIYLGPSLMNRSSASGANLPRIENEIKLTSGTMRLFDSHWNRSRNPSDPNYVDPGAEWLNPTQRSDPATAQWYIDNNADDPYTSFQAENPANYVGWTNYPLNITDSEAAPGNRDLLTTSGRLQKKRTTSKVLVWQGQLLDGAIVGTFGYRKDRAQGWSRSVNVNSGLNEDGVAQTRQYGHINLTPDAYYLPKTGSDLEETSKAWSIVTHFDELPVLKDVLDGFPVRVSAFFNKSANFQPEALRVDVYGEQIALPKGETKDYGLILETRDGKYSLRINKYETAATNANSSGLGGAGFLGNSQVWGGSQANQFEYDFGLNNQPSGAIITNQVNNRPAGAPQPPGWSAQFRPGNAEWDPTNSLYNFGTGGPYATQEAASAYEAQVVAAWRAWQAKVDPRFYAAWGINLNDPFDQSNPKGLTANVPNGFALTEDSTSKGYEIELTAEPIRNWRLLVNAAKTSATRQNIGGKNLAEFIAGYEDALNNTPAGDMRIWWGGAGNETASFQWYQNVGGEWAQRKLQNNTNVPELREWRVNGITTYDFTEGALKGLSVGGGVRWQSEVVIGYRPVPVAGKPRELSFDIANPYMGPAETNFDFWVGYSRKVTDRINWRIQFNVRNAFQDNELIPITAQPDGTPATYRIAPPRLFTLTNTFSF